MYLKFINIISKNITLVPEEYQQVNYISASDSNSSVSSGISAALCKSTYIRARFAAGTSSYYGIFGASWALNGFVLTWSESTHGLQLYSNGVAYEVPNTSDFTDGDVHDVEIPSTGGSSKNVNAAIQIFNFGQRGRTIEIYELIFFGNNEELVAQFIPCYRKSDMKCGFYDIKNRVFCEGSGTFTFG